ncbi:MAG: hypothetical protein WCH46_10860 [bacterium]
MKITLIICTICIFTSALYNNAPAQQNWLDTDEKEFIELLDNYPLAIGTADNNEHRTNRFVVTDTLSMGVWSGWGCSIGDCSNIPIKITKLSPFILGETHFSNQQLIIDLPVAPQIIDTIADINWIGKQLTNGKIILATKNSSKSIGETVLMMEGKCYFLDKTEHVFFGKLQVVKGREVLAEGFFRLVKNPKQD